MPLTQERLRNQLLGFIAFSFLVGSVLVLMIYVGSHGHFVIRNLQTALLMGAIVMWPVILIVCLNIVAKELPAIEYAVEMDRRRRRLTGTMIFAVLFYALFLATIIILDTWTHWRFAPLFPFVVVFVLFWIVLLFYVRTWNEP